MHSAVFYWQINNCIKLLLMNPPRHSIFLPSNLVGTIIHLNGSSSFFVHWSNLVHKMKCIQNLFLHILWSELIEATISLIRRICRFYTKSAETSHHHYSMFFGIISLKTTNPLYLAYYCSNQFGSLSWCPGIRVSSFPGVLVSGCPSVLVSWCLTSYQPKGQLISLKSHG